jgi:hypothetical protein
MSQEGAGSLSKIVDRYKPKGSESDRTVDALKQQLKARDKIIKEHV